MHRFVVLPGMLSFPETQENDQSPLGQAASFCVRGAGANTVPMSAFDPKQTLAEHCGLLYRAVSIRKSGAAAHARLEDRGFSRRIVMTSEE